MYACTSLVDGSSISRAVCLCHRPEVQSFTRLVNADLSRRGFVAGMAASVASLSLLGLPSKVAAQPAAAQARTILFTDFRLFDGRSSGLRDGYHLLVDGIVKDGKVYKNTLKA